MRISLSGRAPEEFNAFLYIIVAGHVAQVVANLVIHALTGGAQLLPRALDDLLVDGKRDVHEHSICAHIICVNSRRPR